MSLLLVRLLNTTQFLTTCQERKHKNDYTEKSPFGGRWPIWRDNGGRWHIVTLFWLRDENPHRDLLSIVREHPLIKLITDSETCFSQLFDKLLFIYGKHNSCQNAPEGNSQMGDGQWGRWCLVTLCIKKPMLFKFLQRIVPILRFARLF